MGLVRDIMRMDLDPHPVEKPKRFRYRGIVFWDDGTKTVVKCENEEYDPEKGLAMAVSKKALGNQGNYYNQFKKWLPEKEEEEEGPTVIIPDIGSPLHEAAKKLAEGVNSALSSLKKDSE